MMQHMDSDDALKIRNIIGGLKNLSYMSYHTSSDENAAAEVLCISSENNIFCKPTFITN